MKKKLFTLLLCAFAVVSANAYTVSGPDANGVVTIDGGSWVNTTVTDTYGVEHTAVSAGEGATGLPDSFTAADLAKLNNASKIIIKGYVQKMLCFQGSDWENITSVDMSEAHFKQDLTSTETVTFRQYNPTTKQTQEVTKTYMTNEMHFWYFTKVSDVKLSKYVESICMKTFDHNSSLTTTFEIPSSVKYIATQAIINTPISRITIPDNVDYINSQAFQNADIKALIDVTVKGYTAAANAAFDKQTTVGQTDADYPDYATLHFPEGADGYFTNTEHKLDVATSLNKGKFQAWLNQHYEKAASCSEPNGWKEFMNAGGGTPEKPAKEVVLRTYSSDVARIVPIGFRAYLVTGVTEATVSGKKQYTVQLQQIFAIPANTGVILYGEIKDKNAGYVLTKIPYWSSDPTDTENYVAPYNRTSGIIKDADNKDVLCLNYMVPTVKATKIYPFYKDMDATDWATIWSANPPTSMASHYTGSSVTDRNFIMTNFQSTALKDSQYDDFVGFFRVKPGVNCGPEKAYLSLPYDIFASPEGAEALVVKPTTPAEMIFRSDVWNDAISTGNWGQRGNIGVLQAKFAGEIFEEEDNCETNGISTISKESAANNDIYTLQGVKVAQPQKGVYVKNGKKVIIK